MAYIPNSISAEDGSQDKNRLQLSSEAGTGSTGSGNGIPSSTPSSAVAGNGAPSNSSGGFTSVRAFLNSNATGGQKLGEGVSGLINKESGEARNALQTGQQTFNQKVNEGTVNYNRADIEKTLGSSSPEIAAETQRQLAGTYTGPKSFNDIGVREQITKETGEALNAANLANTQGGRIELLRQYAGRPMTGGVSRLNEAILSGNPNARQTLDTAAQNATRLGSEVSQAEANAAQMAQRAAETNAGTRQRALQDISDYLNNQDTLINTRYNTLLSEERARQDRARNYLNNVINYQAPLAKAGGSGGLIDINDRSPGNLAKISSLSIAPAAAPAQTNNRAQEGSMAKALSMIRPATDQSRYAAPAPAPAPSIARSSGFKLGGFLRNSAANAGLTPQGNATSFSSPISNAISNAAPEAGAPMTTQIVGQPIPVTPENAPVPVYENVSETSPNLISGFADLGLTPYQAAQLQNAIAENRTAGGSNIDLSRYFTAADLTQGLSKANVIDANTAAKLNALANLTGRQSYQSAPVSSRNAFDYGGALTALTSARDTAKQLAATKAAEAASKQATEAANKAAATPPVINNTTVVKSDPLTSVVTAAINPVVALATAPFKAVGKAIGCVIGASMVENGDWNMSQYAEIVNWCQRTLHGTKTGESLRRGYKFIGCKIAVPNIRKGNIIGDYFKFTFAGVADFAAGRERNIFKKAHAIGWLGLCTVLGVFISDKQAKQFVKDLYKEDK